MRYFHVRSPRIRSIDDPAVDPNIVQFDLASLRDLPIGSGALNRNVLEVNAFDRFRGDAQRTDSDPSSFPAMDIFEMEIAILRGIRMIFDAFIIRLQLNAD